MKRLQKSSNIYDENMNAIWSMIERYAYTEFVRGTSVNIEEE
jgi:hypothetical protein